MRTLTTYSDPALAHLARGLLEMEGIEAVVVGEQVFTFMGSGLKLAVVHEEDYDRALLVLRKAAMGVEEGE